MIFKLQLKLDNNDLQNNNKKENRQNMFKCDQIMK